MGIFLASVVGITYYVNTNTNSAELTNLNTDVDVNVGGDAMTFSSFVDSFVQDQGQDDTDQQTQDDEVVQEDAEVAE